MDVPYRSAHGWIEVITGSMFSGKSEELIRRVRRAQIARQKVQIFKPSVDERFSDAEIVSHSEMRIQGVKVGSSAELLRLVDEDTEVVAIDEAQFFGPGLVPVVGRLADRGLVVIVAGLDVTFDGRPFEPLPSLMALAEQVDKLTAICSLCGEEAVYHVRVGASPAGADDLVQANVGGTETYQARCRRHFEAPAAQGGR